MSDVFTQPPGALMRHSLALSSDSRPISWCLGMAHDEARGGSSFVAISGVRPVAEEACSASVVGAMSLGAPVPPMAEFSGVLPS
jgi:hypothetical protein